ncbi:cupin domain-containing protein [Pelomonas sp. KK5]|uniref:cupin domain-containing protein n=1 Tax=Pelomonas sp. KK5 TaxID=1855730 RepID=UPI001E53E6DB|nr:cupin domain-containing protein [Pelomonas sp. KK5]
MSPEALHRDLIRNYLAVPREAFVREPLYESSMARVSDGTVARQLGCGVDTLPPGKVGCPYHFHHAQEEMFIVIDGRGTLRVAGQMLPIRAGDVIHIPPGPEYPHQIINTSDAPLSYLSISTQQRPEVCEYPDSGKTGAFFGKGKREPLIQRESLDYWDGEP